MTKFSAFVAFLLGILVNANAVPPVLNYAGQVAVNGEAFDGNGLFKFALVNADGTTTYWSNDGTSVDGSEPQASVAVSVNGGLYAVLLGNTAQQGMGAIDPTVFAQHSEAKLRVWFSDGVNGFQQLSPDRPFASVPYAFASGTAQTAGFAPIAIGSISKQMLGQDILSDLNRTITRNMLSSDILSDLNRTVSKEMLGQDVLSDLNRTITRQMLPEDVLSDLNRTIIYSDLSPQIMADLNRTVTKQMLGQDVLSDLNRTVSRSMLSQDILSDLSRTVTYSDLSTEVRADLNRTITPQMIQPSSITTAQLDEQILKYLKPEITQFPQNPGTVYSGQNVTLNSFAQGKFLNYQWFKNDQPIAGANTRIFQLFDLNGSLHDGNYSLKVSNDFGFVTSSQIQIDVNSTRTYHSVSSANNLPMILIEGGTFTMGQAGAATPEHNVTLTYDFYIGQFEVTQQQYYNVTTGNEYGLNAKPSGVYRASRPVVNVSWNDLQIFLSILNSKEEQLGNLPSGWKYTLPTESEWEYACRAGSKTIFAWGNDINSSMANYGGGSIVNVGQYPPNNWGLHDMHGNITEHVADWYGPYTSASLIDPEGPAFGTNRTKRGGAFNFPFQSIKSATRLFGGPDTRFSNLGFRLAFKFMQPDTSDPEIILSGQSNISYANGSIWQEPGYAAYDARDGNITSQVVITGTIDTNVSGTYSVTYTVSDAAGNEANITRTVNVMPTLYTVDLNATVAMDMIWCPPGTFTMGSPTTEAGRGSDETEHNVSLTRGFYLGKYEVAQAQYEAVMTGNPNNLSPTPSNWPNNPDRPVEKVSWDDAQVFLTRLNEQQAGNLPAGWSYVLPTESQWEYACRAGTTTAYSWGESIASTNANYSSSGYSQTRDVGLYAANPWGLFDMHGNVWEWTADWFQAAYPTGNPVVDPSGPASGSNRVFRGGSWYSNGTSLRSAKRRSGSPGIRYNDHGFRVGLQKSQ